MRDRYLQIIRLLTLLIKMRMTPNDKNEGDNAKSLMIKISTFEFIFFLIFWKIILRSANAVSKELRFPRTNLFVAYRLLNISLSEPQYLRELWQSIILTAMALAKSWDGSLEFQQKRSWKVRCE